MCNNVKVNSNNVFFFFVLFFPLIFQSDNTNLRSDTKRKHIWSHSIRKCVSSSTSLKQKGGLSVIYCLCTAHRRSLLLTCVFTLLGKPTAQEDHGGLYLERSSSFWLCVQDRRSVWLQNETEATLRPGTHTCLGWSADLITSGQPLTPFYMSLNTSPLTVCDHTSSIAHWPQASLTLLVRWVTVFIYTYHLSQVFFPSNWYF